MQSPNSATLSPREPKAESAAVFCTSLGWMGLVARGNKLVRLSFGHRSAKSAAEGIGSGVGDSFRTPNRWTTELARRLKNYAAGAPDDFLDIDIEIAHLSPFAASIVQAARLIPFGETSTYGQLAAQAGRPRAARAVGRVMSRNRTPLVVPCHRVVGAGGRLGGFSAMDGLNMKRRLLELEASSSLCLV